MIEFKPILCPIDFSDSSIRSLAYAAVLANWYDAQLRVLHVVRTFDPVPLPGDLGQPQSQTVITLAAIQVRSSFRGNPRKERRQASDAQGNAA